MGALAHSVPTYAPASSSHHVHADVCAAPSGAVGSVKTSGVLKFFTGTGASVAASRNSRRVTPAALALVPLGGACASKASDKNTVLTKPPPAAASVPGGSGPNVELLPGAVSTLLKRRSLAESSSDTDI